MLIVEGHKDKIERENLQLIKQTTNSFEVLEVKSDAGSTENNKNVKEGDLMSVFTKKAT